MKTNQFSRGAGGLRGRAKMRILGISAYYHDSAACIVEDGAIVAAAQEERFTRIKLEEGHALHEAYPPNAELRPLYLEWRKSQPEYEHYPFAFTNE